MSKRGDSTIELRQRYENGGAVGIHGLNLEQRRLIVPGLYMVRSVDFFDSAHEGTLSEEGPYKVRVIAQKGNYDSNNSSSRQSLLAQALGLFLRPASENGIELKARG